MSHPEIFNHQPPLPSGAAGIGVALARHLQLFGELSPEDQQAVLDVPGRVQDFDRGGEIMRIGEKPADVVVVLEGLVQRYTMDEEGRRQIHSFYVATDAPSLEALYIDVTDNALSSVGRSRVGLIPHPILYKLVESRPRVMALMWRQTLVQASIFREALMRNSHKLAHARMAHFFCEMMVRCKAVGLVSGFSCSLPVTQEELADTLGMSPVHINRTLMMLRSSGAVEFRAGTLTITDFGKLSDLAGFDPAYLHLRNPPVYRLEIDQPASG